MINKAQIKDFKARKEYFTHKKDKERLRQLGLEEQDAWKDDLTQPSDSRFRTLYPKSHKQMEDTENQVKKDSIKDKAQKDALLRKFGHDSSQKKALLNLFNKEDGKK